jgi:hypothetical protein
MGECSCEDGGCSDKKEGTTWLLVLFDAVLHNCVNSECGQDVVQNSDVAQKSRFFKLRL